MASMLDACRANQGLPAKLTAGSRVGYDLSKVGAGASRGFSGKKKLEAAPWSGTWPAPGATLDLDFANNRGFVRGVGQGGAMDAITFTRASNGTFVGPDGLLKGYTQGGNNLLANSQEFNNWSPWAGVSVSSNAALDPFGNLTADKVTSTSNGGSAVYQNTTGVAGTVYTVSVFAKKAEASWLVLSGYNGTGGRYAWFNLELGVVGTVSAGQSASIESVGNGWYRCVITMSALVGTLIQTEVGSAVSNNNWGDGTRGIYIWGAQLEVGSTATEYFPTNINVPRFDWASTAVTAQVNLLTATEQFTFANSAWFSANATVTVNVATAPNGTSTANKIVETASTTRGRVTFYYGVPTSNQTFSVYAKAAEWNFVSIGVTNGSGAWGVATFDLINGVTAGGASAGGASVTNATITSAGSGWYRCSVTTVSASGCQQVIMPFNQTGDPVNPSPSLVGDGTSGIYIWGAQHENNMSATTYRAVGSQSPTNTPLRPAPTCNGLLIEEARTNRLLWCRDATQSNWVKTDITTAKDQTGIDGVANAASSLTATADGGTCIQTITLASGSRTGSVFLKRLTGTGIVQVSLDGSTWSTVDLSADDWRRIVLSGTVTNPVVGVRIATSGDAVAMDYGQVEDGAFATSPILTTGASATRSGELATAQKPLMFGWLLEGSGSIAVSCLTYVVPDTNTDGICAPFSFDNGANNWASPYRNDGGGSYNSCVFSIRTTVGGSINQNVAFNLGIALAGNDKTVFCVNLFPYDFSASTNFAPSTSFSSIPLSYPISQNGTFSIGSRLGASALNGCVARLTYWPKKMQISGMTEVFK